MNHTKEPWHIDPKDALRVMSENNTTASCGGPNMIDLEELEANAKRIVECVNALAGIEHVERFVKYEKDRFSVLRKKQFFGKITYIFKD